MDLVRRLALEGLLSDDELAAVIARRAAFGEPAPIALMALRLASAEAIASHLERMGFAPAQRLEPGPAARELPRGMLRALWVLPLGEGPLGAVVAMADPTDRHALGELAFHLRKPVDARSAALDALREVLLQVDPPARAAHTRPPATAALGGAPRDASVDARLPEPGLAEPEAPTSRESFRVPEDALSFATRGPVRRATPAYGQPSERARAEGARALGRVGIPRARPLEPVAAALGTWEPVTRAVGSAPPAPARKTDGPGANPAKKAPSVRVPPVAVPREALYAIAELSTASDRDTIARIAARGMTTEAERAAFFVVKRGVVHGWEGSSPAGQLHAGLTREALRNLWIPITAPSVFRVVNEARKVYLGALSDSTADSILAAALGGRPTRVLVAPIEVRGHVVAFLYADALRDPTDAERRCRELTDASAEALARWLALRAAGR